MADIEYSKEQYGPRFIGQVIRILDEYTLIVNLGSGKVNVGDSLQVYEYLGNLKGPNGEDYGSFEYVKAEIEVIRCEPRYSICKTERVQDYTLDIALTPLLERPTYRRTKLPVEQSDLLPMEPKDRKVRIGDPVKRA